MLDLRPVFFICGVLLAILAVIMLVPAATDLLAMGEDWSAFVKASGVTLFVGISLILANRADGFRLNLRQAFAFTVLSWLIIAAFSALPFAFSKLEMSYTDAFFEAMSGITTTGATVIIGLDNAPPGILLWRSILQWLGGIGIIVFALAFLPVLRVGGMQLFRTEAFETPEKVLPRAAQLAAGIGGVYIGLTVLTAVVLWAAQMAPFDAVNHAMTSIATGGFSTRDASIGAYPPLIQWILFVAMIIGSLPFVYYIDAVRGRVDPLAKDSQVRVFLGVLAAAILLVFAWLVFDRDETMGAAITKAAFNVTSVMTGTGYSTEGFDKWGPFPFAMFFLLMFVGGCAGSTTCGVKIFRFQVAYAVGRVQVSRLMQPRGVFIPYYNRRPITDEVAQSVMGFLLFFALSFGVLALLLGMTGLDPITALSGAASAIANVGPGLGQIIGPESSYTGLNDTAKWLLSAGMLIGRLEIFAVLVLFLPSFWKE
ncbi:MAG: TrkH family potassium uptake protein [Rhodospirillaceae bacterium]|nr:TrkH family potassium uptake protein [Rhodospirillaceae bacterium]